jgi:O-antigen ligase
MNLVERHGRQLGLAGLALLALPLAWVSRELGASSVVVILSAFAGGVLLVHIWRDIQIGALLLLFLGYSRLSNALVSVGLPSLMKLFVAGLILLIVIRWIWQNETLGNWLRPACIYGAYTLLFLTSVYRALEPERVFAGASPLFTNGIIFVLVVALIGKEHDLRRSIWALLAAGGLVGAVSLFQFATGTFGNTYLGIATPQVRNIVADINDYRLSITGLGHNESAQLMVVLVPLAVSRWLGEKRGLLRILAVLVLAIIGLVVLLTYSRSMLLVLAAVAGLLLLRLNVRPRYWILLGAAGALFLLALPDAYVDRLTELTDVLTLQNADQISDPALRGRLSENIVAFQLFNDNWLFGVGEGNYEAHYQQYSRRLGLDERRNPRAAHNLYLEIAAEHGVVGLIALATLEVAVFSGLLRAYQTSVGTEQQAMIAAFGIAVLALLLSHLFLHAIVPRYFWILHGIALAVPRMHTSAGQIERQ